MAVTNGDTLRDVVPIATRQPLLETWVAAKQLQQTQITRSFGTDDEVWFHCKVIAVNKYKMSFEEAIYVNTKNKLCKCTLVTL